MGSEMCIRDRIYTSCEPCPMCLSAIYWSRLDKIYYANTREDAKNIDFDDSFIYTEIPKKIDDRKIKMVQMLRDEALKAFEIWDKKVDKIYYANTREDAKKIDFDDSFIYLEIPKKIDDRKIKMTQMLRDEALKAFEIWDKKVDKIKY